MKSAINAPAIEWYEESRLFDPTRHELILHGMVQRPRTFTIAELGRFPSVTRFHFIECVATSGFGG